MATISDYHEIDFLKEVNEFWAKNNFNFGKDAIPIEVVGQTVLKIAVGYGSGSTAIGIVTSLGYAVTAHNKPAKLTVKGKAFLWWAYSNRTTCNNT